MGLEDKIRQILTTQNVSGNGQWKNIAVRFVNQELEFETLN